MNFLILSRIPEIYSTQRLVQEIENRDHTALVENPESLCAGLPCDVLIPRLGSFRYDESLASFQRLERSLAPRVILNSSAPFANARHKKRAADILQHLPQPRPVLAPSSFPVVVKDCISSQGEGVFLCRTPEELESCRRKLQGREWLAQEFIAESRGRDIRAFVIGDRVAACMERRAQDPETEFRSNLSLGGEAHPVTMTPEEQQLCVEAVRALRLDYAGVDYVRSQRGPLLLEVNPCPGFEGIERCSGKNLAKEVVLYAESLHHSHS